MRVFKTCLLILSLWTSATSTFAQTPDAETAILETFGAVSGVLIYNTYVAIGSIADGFEYEVYDSIEVKSYMDEQIGAMDNMARQYQTLYDSGFLTDAADQEFVLELVTTCHLLSAEASALNQYALSHSDEHVQAFQDSRNRAWEKIAYLLGIE